MKYTLSGVTGPNKDVSPNSQGDKKLAQSAQLYHYQHQKQQIISMENRSGDVNGRGNLSDVESDEENEEDYTVFECPGLAPVRFIDTFFRNDSKFKTSFYSRLEKWK